jgi:hypothetical protein
VGSKEGDDMRVSGETLVGLRVGVLVGASVFRVEGAFEAVSEATGVGGGVKALTTLIVPKPKVEWGCFDVDDSCGLYTVGDTEGKSDAIDDGKSDAIDDGKSEGTSEICVCPPVWLTVADALTAMLPVALPVEDEFCDEEVPLPVEDGGSAFAEYDVVDGKENGSDSIECSVMAASYLVIA